MQAEVELRARLAELEADVRLGYAVANVFVNAPLALIQTELYTEARTLRRILGLPPRRYHGED